MFDYRFNCIIKKTSFNSSRDNPSSKYFISIKVNDYFTKIMYLDAFYEDFRGEYVEIVLYS